MKRWNQTWNCSHIWKDETDAQKAAQALTAFLAKERDRPQNEGVYEYIDELVDEFDGISQDANADANDFDCALGMLYDFCDSNSIWVRP